MCGIFLKLEHSVEAEVSLEFAWKYRTDIANWNDPPAMFTLDGPFVAGSPGTTLLPGQPPLHWRIIEVRRPGLFVLEMPLDGALLTFEWRFEMSSEHRTKMTQTIVLAGENAKTYAEHVEAGFKPNLADGMKKISSEMYVAERRLNGASGHAAGTAR